MAISDLKVKISLTRRITFWPTYLVLVAAYWAVNQFNSDKSQDALGSMYRLMFKFLYKVEVQ